MLVYCLQIKALDVVSLYTWLPFNANYIVSLAFYANKHVLNNMLCIYVNIYLICNMEYE